MSGKRAAKVYLFLSPYTRSSQIANPTVLFVSRTIR